MNDSDLQACKSEKQYMNPGEKKGLMLCKFNISRKQPVW